MLSQAVNLLQVWMTHSLITCSYWCVRSYMHGMAKHTAAFLSFGLNEQRPSMLSVLGVQFKSHLVTLVSQNAKNKFYFKNTPLLCVAIRKALINSTPDHSVFPTCNAMSDEKFMWPNIVRALQKYNCLNVLLSLLYLSPTCSAMPVHGM